MDTLTLTARRASGEFSFAQFEAAKRLLENALPPNSEITSSAFNGGGLSFEALIPSGVTEAQFQNFVDGILPDGIFGSVALSNALGEELYSASIPAASGQAIQGRTNPAPTPLPTTWTVTKS